VRAGGELNTGGYGGDLVTYNGGLGQCIAVLMKKSYILKRHFCFCLYKISSQVPSFLHERQSW